MSDDASGLTAVSTGSSGLSTGSDRGSGLTAGSAGTGGFIAVSCKELHRVYTIQSLVFLCVIMEKYS